MSKKIIEEVKDKEFKEKLTEGFQTGTFMTAYEFCKKLEMQKTSLINKHKMRYGNDNS